MDLRVPPLVGTYGRSGAGKTSDKVRAFPRGYFFASPGGLIPAISEVGITPRFEELTQVADLDMLRQRAEAALRRDRTIDSIVIDDLSMIAARTERTLKTKIRDGRALYGAIKEKMGNLFDDWRNYGLVVAVDCHEQPPTWRTTEDGADLAHTPENRIAAGVPNLPGRQAAPEMVKAFDLFYRVVQGANDPLQRSSWPWRYKAGPWGDGADWETKDRWGVARGPDGIVPLNLGEILRFIHRRYTPSWKVYRPVGQESDEEMVAWGATNIAADPGKASEVYRALADRIVGAKSSAQIDPIKRARWVIRDVQARVEIEGAHSQAALLRELGVSGF